VPTAAENTLRVPGGAAPLTSRKAVSPFRLEGGVHTSPPTGTTLLPAQPPRDANPWGETAPRPNRSGKQDVDGRRTTTAILLPPARPTTSEEHQRQHQVRLLQEASESSLFWFPHFSNQVAREKSCSRPSCRTRDSVIRRHP